MIWLNRTFFFATVTLIASILLFSSQVIAKNPKNCRTVTKTCSRTITVFPLHCPTPLTTTTTIESIITALSTTTTFATTIITVLQAPVKRTEPRTICILDKSKNGYVFHGRKKCEKIVVCNPTVFLPCPKVNTNIITETSTLTTTLISTLTSLTTSTYTTCKPDGAPCDIGNYQDIYACCNMGCSVVGSAPTLYTCYNPH
ncbi:hypothetical protein Glove_301g12 [Diversispora epigaea]|uniref:WAP domain-containing protein n=1 Tax=Diversispora epigaea TaxID=1348612 RepID=A0A397HWM5_9GLOM|nr:hypothetical protein Glove_301g12 [Diversispora epigaea]